jgi:hypothetical protein
MKGRIAYFNNVRHYGFIESEVAGPEGGYWVKRFFLAPAHIQFCGTQEITPGCYVEFELSTKPPRNPEKDLPFAANVYIYRDEQQAKEIKTLMTAKGVQKP